MNVPEQPFSKYEKEVTDSQKQWGDILYEIAIRYLSRREFSKGELLAKLTLAYYNKSKNDKKLALLEEETRLRVLNKIMLRLERENYLSDLRFAQMLIKTRSNNNYGLFRIKMELREKGVSEETIEMALESTTIDWFELSRSAYKKRFTNREKLDWEEQEKEFDKKKITRINETRKEKSRRIRFLQSRGFSQDEISYAIS